MFIPVCRNLFHTFDVTGKRAYKPRTAGDLNIGDVVKFRRCGGRIEVGQVQYVGHLPGKSQPFIGVELEHASEFISSDDDRSSLVDLIGGAVAQRVERWTCDEQVVGSNPTRGNSCVTTLASCSHLCAYVTKQYNLVPAKGRWCSTAGKVTAGLAESNGSVPPVG